MLDMWITDSGNNDCQLGKGAHKDTKAYSLDLTDLGYDTKVENGTWAETYDVIIADIKSCSDTEKRYELMHRAEDLLMSTGAYDEISNSNGNMVITIRPRGSNIMEQGVTTDVKVLPNANKKNKERLVAVFNTESLLQNLTINIFSSLNKIKRVVFIIDD
jgi:hypothetical protein